MKSRALISTISMLAAAAATAAAATGRVRAADDRPSAVPAPPSPRDIPKLATFLNDKNRERMVTRCDKTQVTFFTSEAGRYSKANEYVDRESAARYAAHKILASKIDELRPGVLASWRESGFSLFTRERHTGEAGTARARSGRKLDVDVGLRSGRPFVGTTVARTRLTATWDWREHRAILAASRPLGPLDTRVELRYGDDREVRFGIAIPFGR